MKQMTAILFVSFLLLFSSAFALAQSSNTATVIFYRASDDGGKAYALTHQNQKLAKLKKGEKFEQALVPGTSLHGRPDHQASFQARYHGWQDLT